MSQLLQNAAYGTIMILAVMVLRRVLRDRLSPVARLAFWGVCLFRLLTPRPFQSVLSLWGLASRLAPAVLGSPALALPPEAGVSALPGTPVNPTVPAADPVPAPFPWEKVLVAAWVLVGAALAVWYLVGWFRARRAVNCAVPVGEDDPRRRFLPWFAQLREGPVEGAPLTFGVVRPQVVLSPGLDEGELACVLAHEGVHARRRDNLWHYAMAAALVVHWWNPAVWLMSRLLRRDIELACDRAALKQLGEDCRAEYAQALVTLSTQGEENGPAFCQSFGRKATEERIRSIMKFKKPTIIGVVLTLVLVLGVSIAFASDPKAPEDDYVDEGVILDDYKVANVPTATDEYGNSLVYDEDGNLLIVGTRDHDGPHDLCSDPACQVTGAHYHDKDGNAVKVYYQMPGLLCTKTDCPHNGGHQHGGVSYDACAATCTPEQYAAALDAWVAQGVKDRQEADGWLEIFRTCYDHVQAGDTDAFYYNIYNGTQMASAFYKSDRAAAGYPVNSKGETYGSGGMFEVYGASPDLILAMGTNGETGYIRDSDDPGACVRNPDEAMIYMEWCKTQPSVMYVPLYDSEGNVIGRFAYGNNSGYAADPSVKPEDAQLSMDAWLAYLASREQAAAQVSAPACGVQGCTEAGEHHHDPAQTLCTAAGCTATGEHDHNGVHYCGTAVACTVDGCGSTGVHEHNGMTYNGCANAAHHESAASSTTSTTSSNSTSSHHSESHSSGHHGNHH